MAELKTTQTDNSVDEFLNSIADHKRSKDCLAVVNLMKTITKAEPKKWGASIVGFGSYHYKYESGREAVKNASQHQHIHQLQQGKGTTYAS